MGQRVLPAVVFELCLSYPVFLFHGKSHGNFIFWKSVVGLTGLRIFLYFFQRLLWLSWLLMDQRTHGGSTLIISTCARA